MSKRTVAAFVISLVMVLSRSAYGNESNDTTSTASSSTALTTTSRTNTTTTAPSNTVPTTSNINTTTITPAQIANSLSSTTITINSKKWTICDQPDFLKNDYDTFSSIMKKKTKLYYLYYWKNKENEINADELYLILDDKSAQYYAKINNIWYYRTEDSHYTNSDSSEHFGSDYDCYGLTAFSDLPDYEVVIDESKIVVGNFIKYLGHELYYNKGIGFIYDLKQTAMDIDFDSGDFHMTIYQGDLKNSPVQSLDFTSYTKFDEMLQFIDINFDGILEMEIWGNNTCTIPDSTVYLWNTKVKKYKPLSINFGTCYLDKTKKCIYSNMSDTAIDGVEDKYIWQGTNLVLIKSFSHWSHSPYTQFEVTIEEKGEYSYKNMYTAKEYKKLSTALFKLFYCDTVKNEILKNKNGEKYRRIIGKLVDNNDKTIYYQFDFNHSGKLINYKENIEWK